MIASLPRRMSEMNPGRRPVYAVYGGQQKILRLMQLGFALQVAIMAVSLGVSMPKIATGFYCKAADLPAEMVIFRCVDPSCRAPSVVLKLLCCYSTASIMYETFLFGLMMVGVIRGSKIGLSDTALLRVIVRDGAMAFVGIYCECKAATHHRVLRLQSLIYL